MKNESKIVTFTGAELYSLLPTEIQILFLDNVLKQHDKEHFDNIMKKENYPNMLYFLRGGFLFAFASPSPKFWVDFSRNYYQEFEDAAIAEII